LDTARINIAMCFPELDTDAREALVRRNLVETGRSVAEMLRIWVGPRLALESLIDENGFEAAVRALLARGHGVILAMPHIGNWELAGDIFVRLTPATALFRPPRLPALEPIMREGRARTGVTPVPIDRHGLKAMHGALQRGEGIVILPDQVPKTAGASGVVAPFFGRPAMTMTLISRLARRHQSPVLFCCVVPGESGGRHQMFHFEGEAAIADADPEIAAAALNRDVERCARAFPAHYQWTYRRFEIPGRKAESPYRR
jgi:KDO2-lipid IV(A) lauroyltransferase